MPSSVTDPLNQLVSWGLWLGAVVMVAKMIQLAPTVYEQWRRAERGRTSKEFMWWTVGAIVLSSAGTIASVVLN